MNMKIGIDARLMGKGYGIGRYIEQLVLHLAKIDSKNEYVLFVCDKEGLPVQHSAFTIVEADIPWYSLEEQIKFSKIIKQAGVDLMHFPHWNVPLFYSDSFVLTIHDLTMYHFPRPEATTLGPLKFWLKDRVHRIILRHAASKARHIFVTSEFTKHDVHSTLGIPNEKMTVTYQAPYSSKFEHETSDKSALLEKHGITKPYVLYVGAAYPHKNLEGLLKSWKTFEDKHSQDYQLVLVGKANYFYKRLQSDIRNLTSAIYVGFVSDDELSILYHHADLFVFPSLYEGFGMPPLEAMAHGVPVVSSNRSCMPEVLGEAALYVDPENHQQFADAIYTGLTDQSVRDTLRTNAQKESQRYCWESLTRGTLAVYSSL
jgi:glycosyltransferase involved in cell wall biosynthesis